MHNEEMHLSVEMYRNASQPKPVPANRSKSPQSQSHTSGQRGVVVPVQVVEGNQLKLCEIMPDGSKKYY